jgi:hypothetical protein
MVASSRQQLQDIQALDRTAPPQQWQKDRVPLLDGGMRTDKLGRDLQLNESPYIFNLTLIANKLRVDTGYIQMGTGPMGVGGFIGTPQLFYQVFNQNGTSTELLVTTKTVYQLVQAFNQWQLAPSGNTVGNANIILAGSGSFTATSTTGLAVGDYLGIPLDDTEQLQAQIIIINGSTVFFNPVIPAGRSVPINSPIIIPYSLNGSVDSQVCAQSYPAKDWVIFSNAIDPLFYWTGTAVGNFTTTTDLPVNTTATWMALFHSSLFLLGTEEAGQEYPQRVRMSDIGNPQSWTPAAYGGPPSSIAAIYDLIDTEDFIQCGFLLGPYLIIYRETTIMRGSYVGLLDAIMYWEYMVSGEGVRSSGSVSELGSSQEIVGNGGIYEYTADYFMNSTGDAIFVNFISAIGDLNPAAQSTLFCQYQQDYDENWIIYPSGSSSLPNKMLRHSMEKGGWFIRQFANEFISASPYLPLETTIWATWVGTWAQQTAQWNSRVFIANVANFVLCAPDTNQVYIYDYTHQTDSGTVIPWTVQTKDLGQGDVFQRWNEVRVSGLGSIANVQYSMDEGNTWTSLGPLTLGAGRFSYLTFQAVSAYIRFQLSGTDSSFQLDWLEVWYQQESEY